MKGDGVHFHIWIVDKKIFLLYIVTKICMNVLMNLFFFFLVEKTVRNVNGILIFKNFTSFKWRILCSLTGHCNLAENKNNNTWYFKRIILHISKCLINCIYYKKYWRHNDWLVNLPIKFVKLKGDNVVLNIYNC